MLIILRSISYMGKSTLASDWHRSVVVSSDDIRMELIGTKNVHPSLSGFIWREVETRIQNRLKDKLVTIVDATNLSLKSVNKMTKLATSAGSDFCIVSIVPDLSVIEYRRAKREECIVSDEDIARQYGQYVENTPKIKAKYGTCFFEGDFEECKFYLNHVISENNKQIVFGDCYVIGDIHGCIDELKELLDRLPLGCSIYSVGDIIDRGPGSMECLMLLNSDPRFRGFTMGNHEYAFLRELEGKRCNSYARQKTHQEFDALEDTDREDILEFIKSGVPYYILQNPDTRTSVLISHAGVDHIVPENTGIRQCSSDRINGATNTSIINGIEFQIHGHSHWLYTGDFSGTVVNIDSGCIYGHHLTAINAFNENDVVTVAAKRKYFDEK